MDNNTEQTIGNMPIEKLVKKFEENCKILNKLDKDLMLEDQTLAKTKQLTPYQIKKIVLANLEAIRFTQITTFILRNLQMLEDQNSTLFQIVNEEMIKNKETSEETKIKLKKLEEEIKKKKKMFSFIENLTIGMNPMKFTGAEIGD